MTHSHNHTIYITSYYNQASPQTVESQQTFSNPCSSSAETVEGQYTFGNPHSSSAVTVEVQETTVQSSRHSKTPVICWKTFGNSCCSSAEAVVGQQTFGDPHSSSARSRCSDIGIIISNVVVRMQRGVFELLDGLNYQSHYGTNNSLYMHFSMIINYEILMQT